MAKLKINTVVKYQTTALSILLTC